MDKTHTDYGSDAPGLQPTGLQADLVVLNLGIACCIAAIVVVLTVAFTAI